MRFKGKCFRGLICWGKYHCIHITSDVFVELKFCSLCRWCCAPCTVITILKNQQKRTSNLSGFVEILWFHVVLLLYTFRQRRLIHSPQMTFSRYRIAMIFPIFLPFTFNWIVVEPRCQPYMNTTSGLCIDTINKTKSFVPSKFCLDST